MNSRFAAHPVLPASALPAPPGAQPVSTAREAKTAQLDMGSSPAVKEVVAVQTAGAWTGCDVYVIPPIDMVTLGGFLRVFVYAIVEGVGKTLVGSGVWFAPDNSSIAAPIRIASARTTKAIYQVSFIASYSSIAPNQQNTMAVTIVASDDMGPPDDSVGVSPLFQGVQTAAVTMYGPLGATFGPCDWEVVSIVANNFTASQLSLQLFDFPQASLPLPANLVPQFSLQVPAHDSRVYKGPFWQRFGVQGLIAAISSDPSKYVAAANGLAYEVFLR